jgi:hypothetical protein
MSETDIAHRLDLATSNGNTPWKSLDAGRRSAVAGADRQRQVVGADFDIAQASYPSKTEPGT